ASAVWTGRAKINGCFKASVATGARMIAAFIESTDSSPVHTSFKQGAREAPARTFFLRSAKTRLPITRLQRATPQLRYPCGQAKRSPALTFVIAETKGASSAVE